MKSWVFITGILFAVAQITQGHALPQPSRAKCNACPATREYNALGRSLSKKAKVYFPCSEGFAEAKARWSTLAAPDVTIVVEPGTEQDVAETVKFANKVHMPFMAVTSGHGTPITQGRMKNGIEIRMHQLNSVELIRGGTHARVGGGAKAGPLNEGLWAKGKQAVTGVAECVGLVGPALGGGRGLLQGRHGLVGDQFVSMNIVLADGSRRTIDETSDLWWAMRGAGHNFAILTSMTIKVFDIEHPNWALERYIFTGDKVAAVHDMINQHIIGNTGVPADVSSISILASMPETDEKPVLVQHLGQEGVTKVDKVYSDLFRNLTPVAVEQKSGRYIDIPSWIGDSATSPDCQNTGAAHTRFPIELERFNSTAMEQIYKTFAAGLAKNPAFNQSVIFIEAYPQQGVQAVARDSSACAFRDDSITIAPTLQYMPDGPALDKQAEEFGLRMRDILHKASGRDELHVYVNYAYGTETSKNLYGYEQWRQERLRSLKRKYDPHGRFRFYAPIE